MRGSVSLFEIDAKYHQFYVMDDEIKPLIPEEITDQDIANRFRVAPNIAVLHTLNEGRISVEVEVAEASPPSIFAGWDHIVEFSVDIPCGRMVLAGCTDYLPDCPRIDVPLGSIRGRASFRDAAGDNGEFCSLVFWPHPMEAPRVLKHANAS